MTDTALPEVAWELAGNPYLDGLFGPVDEERDDDALAVIGEIPADLDGVFVRNGPNPQFSPDGRYHWFDGDGMVHALRFHNGRASYRNRWIRTRALEQETAAAASLFTGVMENPAGNPTSVSGCR